MSPVRCVALAFVLSACATAPQLDPRLGAAADEIVREMAAAANADVPKPPLMYCLSGAWIDLCMGTIVAVGDGAFAARFSKTENVGIPVDALHYLVPVDDDRNSTIKGDGVVTRRIGDILVCRYFSRGTERLQLGDSVWIDAETTEAVRERMLGRR